MTDKLEQENRELKHQLAAIKKERDAYRGQIRIGEEQKKFHAAAVAVGCNPSDTEDLFAIFKEQIETHKMLHPSFFQPRGEGTPSKEYNQNSLTDRTQQYLESQKNTPTDIRMPLANPFARENENLTEQTRIYRENPLLAEKLKSQAG
jgi:hypothetical protein